MEKVIKDEAIVLKKSLIPEDDISLTIYSKKLGKENIYIPRGQLLKSPYITKTEPFNWFYGIFKFARDKVYIEEIDNYKNIALTISHDIQKFYLNSYFVSLFSKYISFPDERFYFLLKKSIYYSLNMKNFYLHRLNFLTKFVYLFGVFPELKICVNCNKLIDNKTFFSLTSDLTGAICKDCYRLFNKTSHYLNYKDIEYLLAIRDISFKDLEKLKISEKRIEKLFKFLSFYMQNQS